MNMYDLADILRALTMLHPWADLFWQMPHSWEGKIKKCPDKCLGRISGL